MRESASAILPISVVVLTKDEEDNLGACLKSVAGWVREMWVVDSGSADRTIEIAQQYTDRISRHEFENYAQQRNWALANLPPGSEWVLNLDADHRVTPELRAELIERFQRGVDSSIGGFLIPRKTVFMGRWIRHGGHYPVYQAVLFRRGRGRCEDRGYDQHFLIDGRAERLESPIEDVFTESVGEFIRKHKRWARAEAEEIAAGRERGQQVAADAAGNPIEQRRAMRERYYRLPIGVRPFLYFGWRYFYKGGILDGLPGLVFHSLQGLWFRILIDVNLLRMRAR